MSGRLVETILWPAAIALLVMTGRSVSTLVRYASEPSTPKPSAYVPWEHRPAEPTSAIPTLRNPFVFAHGPPDVSTVSQNGGGLSPVRSGPVLILTGTLGGPPWTAIIEIEGQSGSARVVRRGDELEDLRVRGVGRDFVDLIGPDSMFRLWIRKPWH